MNIFKSLRGCAIFLLGTVTVWCAQPATYRSDYETLSSGSWVQDKNFYVLTLFQKLPAARSALALESTLQASGLDFDFYAVDSHVIANHMLLSDETIEAVRTILVRLEPTKPALQSLVTDHLRPSGAYIISEGKSDAELLGEAWVEAARGINGVIQRYVIAGKADNGIDSPSYDPDLPGYQKMIANVATVSSRSGHNQAGILVFEPSLNFALQLLALNRRDEPARHEPLAAGENRAAMEAAKHLDWAKFKYASLLVHGIGPETPGVAISSDSRANCVAAAKLYRDGAAPLIIVSGGYVHPKQTIFCEAVEMKKELMLVHGIPESAILIEPQARHTTTNVRNGVRLLLALGAPLDKPSLSVAQKEHVDYIASDKFRQYCLEHYGVRCGPRTSDTTAEFLPSVNCMQTGTDPLDP